MSDTALLNLTPTQLALVAGDRRQRLLSYLLRWGHSQVALHYLNDWLGRQPALATLREARARVLLAIEQPGPALELLNDLDAERGVTESRRTLRVRALAQQGQWDAALELLPLSSHNTASGWRLRADLLLQQGRFAEAAAALAQAAALMPEGSTPTRSLAELALAQGDPAAARQLLVDKQQRLEDQLDCEDLRLLVLAAEQLDDPAAAELRAQLERYQLVECEALTELLGLDLDGAPQLPDSPQERTNGRQLPAGPDPTASRFQPSIPDCEPLPDVLAALREHFGHSEFRPGQAAVVARALAGQNTLAVMPTGSGKSLTYQLPSLLLPGATVVISPLIALMKDQIDNLPPAVRERATAINSSLEPGELAARLQGLAEGRYKLVYVAPERLRQQPFVQALRQAGLSLFVVDEAHCVSLWGVSFRPDYLFISRVLDELGRPPVLALTATATPETQDEIRSQLGDLQLVSTSVFRSNLRFEVVSATNQEAKLRAVAELCAEITGPIIVYARSRASCEQLAATLRSARIAAEHYHALVDDRAGVQERFMAGHTRVLVATVAFGMGVDKSDVRTIIHYNLPQSVEAYYQEAGRAGRDGEPARCILLYTSSDKSQLSSWLRQGALTRDFLRDVYRSLKRQMQGTWGVVTLGEVQRELREEDETRLRVALGLLERAGLLVRHFDLPRAATLILRSSAPNDLGDPAFAAFVAQAGLYHGEPVDLVPLELARRIGLPPAQIEPLLIGWHRSGWLRYTGTARDLLIELLPAPPDSGSRLDGLLGDYSDRQSARIAAIADYARSLSCRHRAIARHFGEQLAPCGSACDVCIGQQPGDAADSFYHPAVSINPQDAILAAVAELPGRLNDKELSCLLLGQPGYPESASYGALAGSSFVEVRQQIGRLVAIGKLAYQARALVPSVPARLAPRSEPAGLLVLRCLQHIPFGVGRSGLAKVLKAAAGSPIQGDRCPEYGALHDLSSERIEALIEAMINGELLVRDESNNYRLISLTPYAKQVLQDPSLLPEWAELRPATAISRRQAAAPADTEPLADNEAVDPADAILLERLTDWRKQKAQELGLPSFYVLSNATVNAIAVARPTTRDALGRIKGIGQQKLTQYADEVLALIDQ